MGIAATGGKGGGTALDSGAEVVEDEGVFPVVVGILGGALGTKGGGAEVFGGCLSTGGGGCFVIGGVACLNAGGGCFIMGGGVGFGFFTGGGTEFCFAAGG